MNPVQSLRSAYVHIVSSKRASLWFIVICVHVVVQVSLQVVTYTENTAAKKLVDMVIAESILPSGITIIEGNQLQMCNGIPGIASTTCNTISYGPTDAIYGQMSMINVTLPNGVLESLSSQCIQSLSWLEEIFRDAKSEDVVTICFQFWLFIVSLLAVLHDSIPHLTVAVASHILDTAWASFRIKATIDIHQAYSDYIVEGTCNGTDILGTWWNHRMSHAIPVVVTNAVALVAIVFLARLLFWAFMKQSFSRVGASSDIHRGYKLLLCFEANMELALFFDLAAMGMWIDRISTGAIHNLLQNVNSFLATFIATLVILPIWVLAGWVSVRREIRWLFAVFLLIQFIVIANWLVTFASVVYRYEIRAWPFFACMSITSVVFLLGTMITSIVCRINFGTGLSHFLGVQAALDSADFTPGYFENDNGSKARLETEPDFSLMDAIKVKEDKLNGFELPVESPNHHSSHKIRPVSVFKRIKPGAVKLNVFRKEEHIEGRFSLLGEPKFILPVRPTPVVAIPSRILTSSMMSQSPDTISPSIVMYARRLPVSSAVARTMSIDKDLHTEYDQQVKGSTVKVNLGNM